jgi:hypothetical protein
MGDNTDSQLAFAALIGVEFGKALDEKLGKLVNPPCELIRKLQVGNQNTPAGNYIDMGAPAEGRYWHIRRITIIDNDPWTSDSGGYAAICAGTPPQSGYNATDIMTLGIIIPSTSTFSHGELTVWPGVRLYVQVNGGSGNVIVTGQVCEHRMGEGEA